MPRAPDHRRRRDRTAIIAAAAVLLLIVAAYAGYRAKVQNDHRRQHIVAITRGGDPDRGRAAVQHYGCGGCHTISAIRNANGLVGPPLDGVGKRVYLAGVVPNTPDEMIAWIRDPRAIDAKTAMPNTGVTTEDARDIAAFLYSLQ